MAEKRLYSVKELAQRYHVSRQAVYKQVEKVLNDSCIIFEKVDNRNILKINLKGLKQLDKHFKHVDNQVEKVDNIVEQSKVKMLNERINSQEKNINNFMK